MRTIRIVLSKLFLAASIVLLVFMAWLCIRGTRIDLGFTRLKTLADPFRLLMILYGISLLVHPDWKVKISNLKERFAGFCSKSYAKWILIGGFALLFVWQQIAEYLSLKINFLPFSFYDYMLYYIFQGKIYWTGHLHDYYHVNTLLYALAPLWYLIKSPWLLVIAHGIIVAASAIPLYAIAKLKFKETFVPFLITFIYLSYTFLQNILLMNFSVEAFYPLIIFSLLYCIVTKRTVFVFIFTFLTFLIKDDAPFYVGALGGFLILTEQYRKYGIAILGLSLIAFFGITKLVVPNFGKMAQRLAENYPRYGTSVQEVAVYILKHPIEIIKSALYPWDKLQTYCKVFRYLLFIPLVTPWALTVFAAAFPVMMTDAPGIFMSLDCQYSAPLLPFLFFALVYGLSNIAWWANRNRERLLWILLLAMVFLNGGHYSVYSVTNDTLKTINLAKSVPQDSHFVMSGALLPYVGYREHNFYIAPPFVVSDYDGKEHYLNPDYCLLVDNIDLYPVDKCYIEHMRKQFMEDSRYDLIYEDEHRWLFKSKET